MSRSLCLELLYGSRYGSAQKNDRRQNHERKLPNFDRVAQKQYIVEKSGRLTNVGPPPPRVTEEVIRQVVIVNTIPRRDGSAAHKSYIAFSEISSADSHQEDWKRFYSKEKIKAVLRDKGIDTSTSLNPDQHLSNLGKRKSESSREAPTRSEAETRLVPFMQVPFVVPDVPEHVPDSSPRAGDDDRERDRRAFLEARTRTPSPVHAETLEHTSGRSSATVEDALLRSSLLEGTEHAPENVIQMPTDVTLHESEPSSAPFLQWPLSQSQDVAPTQGEPAAPQSFVIIEYLKTTKRLRDELKVYMEEKMLPYLSRDHPEYDEMNRLHAALSTSM